MAKDKKYRFAIVVSEFNKEISKGLLSGALKVLNKHEIPQKKIKVFHCPGSFEIPLTAKRICEIEKYDAVICLGAVIKGETAHFEYISSVVSSGIAKLNLEYDIPVTFGVLTCYNEEQAVQRSSDNDNNKGTEAALAALQMLELLKTI
jgi:6,7-dimethyl-8-ribityllumazine synthase